MMLRLKFFPFFVVKRYSLRSGYLKKLSDNEIIEYIFQELEKEEYKKINLTETTIEFKGDHSFYFFETRQIRAITQAIDYGTVSIIHQKNRRYLVFKYQSTIFTLPTLAFGIAVYFISGNVLYGLYTFVASFILVWLEVHILQNMTISGCIDKLEYRERWKKS